MGYPLTAPDDYKGLIAISTNKYTRSDLENYILTYEQTILQDLLGCDMEADFIADLDVNNSPQDAKFIDIFNAFAIDDDSIPLFINHHCCYYDYNPNYTGYGCKVQWKSKGILELLRYLIFFYYTRDQSVVNTVTGNVKNENNVSTEATIPMATLRRNYNKGLEWYFSIQWKILKNTNAYDYTNFNGIITEPISII